MKSKFTTFIMIIIMILIICVLGIFAIMLFQEVDIIDTTAEAEDFQSTISEVTENKETVNTVEKNIQTPNVVENPLDSIKDNGTNNLKKVNYSNVSINKYFYNQLSADSQTIYKAFEANLQNMRSGNYRIELGDSFASILNQDNGQEELGNKYQSAFEAFNYDNPGVFYLDANKMFLNIETTTTGNKKKYNVFIDSGNQSNYFTDEFSSKAQVDNAVSLVEQVKNQIIANKTGNTYQDIKMVHDYLLDNLEYDTSISRPHIYTIYGALINKVCVCEGYARAFKYIMDSLNIPCVMVMGEGTNSQGQRENHAWNYVQIDGRWFAIDATWDDPVVQGGGRASNESRYKYFLKGSSTFNQDHVPNGRFTDGGKVFTYPIISSGDYN